MTDERTNSLKFTPAALKALVDGDIANFLIADTPGGIEAQEAQGQQDLCSSRTLLPKDAPWDKLEALGVKKLEDHDDIFVKVSMPTGWELRPTDHSMWSELFDADNKKIASVFYKAAFYDRHAHLRLAETDVG